MTPPGLLLAGANEIRSMALSIVMAIASAGTALTLAKNSLSAPKNERIFWSAGSAAVIAVGIWAGRILFDGASAAPLRNAAIAAVVVSFLIGATATAASDKRFLARALRRRANHTADDIREPQAPPTVTERTDPALIAPSSDLLALNATLRVGAGASVEPIEGDAAESQPAQPSTAAFNSQLPK